MSAIDTAAIVLLLLLTAAVVHTIIYAAINIRGLRTAINATTKMMLNIRGERTHRWLNSKAFQVLLSSSFTRTHARPHAIMDGIDGLLLRPYRGVYTVP